MCVFLLFFAPFKWPVSCLSQLNNCLAKWRLGAWDIQELPLLAASSQMETTPMADKSRQPSHEPSHGGRKQVPITLKKQWKEREGQGRGDSLQGIPTLRKTLTLRKRWLKTPTKLLQRPMDQAHQESWHMRISNKPLTAKVKLVLLVVNSVKLHLTAYNVLHPMPDCNVNL